MRFKPGDKVRITKNVLKDMDAEIIKLFSDPIYSPDFHIYEVLLPNISKTTLLYEDNMLHLDATDLEKLLHSLD